MSEQRERKTKYRMYVDEVGNSDLRASENPNHRYLSLTGVVIELDYVDQHVEMLERLKYDRDRKGEIYGWGRKWLP